MKIEIHLQGQELRGNQMVRFEVADNDGNNIGAFIVGRAGIRWEEPRAYVNAKTKSWNEVIKWLQQHGRTVRR
ncbi:MAG TPA: hypothetical protein VI855_09850 [Dehalococcoidia bacterium]|nr:hypothetical protein [Dehalococcoidia bacterium]